MGPGNLMFVTGVESLKSSAFKGSNYSKLRQRNIDGLGNQARKSMDNGQFRKLKGKKTALVSGGKGSSIEPSSEPKERPMSSKHYSASLKDRRRVVQYAQRKQKKSGAAEDFPSEHQNVNYGPVSPEQSLKHKDYPFSMRNSQQADYMSQSAAFNGFGL